MELIDKIISTFNPKAGAMRAYWKLRQKRLYDAAKTNNYHRKPASQGSGDKNMDHARGKIRDWARYLDENHDLAIGVLDELVNKIVGTGITLEPLAASAGGVPAQELNRQIANLWRRWGKSPEVTGELNMNQLQRQMARTWLRDGEGLIQHVLGNKPGLVNSAGIPYALELIEADYLPFEFIDENRGILHGVQKNAWGRPTNYFLLKEAPDESNFRFIKITDDSTKRVQAELISHIKFTRRLKQTRGVSIFHGVAYRLDDIKDYEESERVAAKIAASFCAGIRKGTDFDPSQGEENKQYREMEMQAGMIFDDLLPGEDIFSIDSNRPNPELSNFRNSQMKAVAGGTGTSYSSISRNYDGTYSAQRQELVESRPAYSGMRDYFISALLDPVYRHFINAAILSGALRVPPGVDIETVFEADWIPPPQPWIDPLKEIKADREAVDAEFKTTAQVVRERTGRDPNIVREQIKAEQAAKAEAEPEPIEEDPPEQPGADDENNDSEAA